MDLKGTPKCVLSQEVSTDIYTNAVPLLELHHLGHPHGAVGRGRVGALCQLPDAFAGCGVSGHNDTFASPASYGLFCEGHVGIQEVDAVLAKQDGIVAQCQCAPVAHR